MDKETNVVNRAEYATKEFWDGKFKSWKSTFDWYINYQQLKKFILFLMVKKDCRVLIVGCGNSSKE